MAGADATGEWELVTFGRTPPMSTYLAAWATGRFECVRFLALGRKAHDLTGATV